MTSLKTIEMMYDVMNIQDESEESEFWELILLINGLKLGFLPQQLSDTQVQIGLEIPINNGEIDEDTFGITSFIIQDYGKELGLGREYIDHVSSATWTSLNNLKNIVDYNIVNKKNFIGLLLGYQCPGDYLQKTITFVKFTLTPSPIYKKMFGIYKEIDLTTYSCATFRVNKIKPRVLAYIKKLNSFFSKFDLGNVSVKYIKRGMMGGSTKRKSVKRKSRKSRRKSRRKYIKRKSSRK